MTQAKNSIPLLVILINTSIMSGTTTTQTGIPELPVVNCTTKTPVLSLSDLRDTTASTMIIENGKKKINQQRDQVNETMIILGMILDTQCIDRSSGNHRMLHPDHTILATLVKRRTSIQM